MRKHPLAPFALVFVIGSALGLSLDCLCPPPARWFLAPLLLGLVSLVPFPRRRRWLSFSARLLACALLALLWAIRRDAPSDAALDLLFSRASGEERFLFVTGELSALRPPAKASFGERKYRFRLKDPSVRERAEGVPSAPLPDSIAVTWYGPPPGEGRLHPEKGARWEVKGKVCQRRGAAGASRDLREYFLVSRASATRVVEGSAGKGILSRLRDHGAAVLSRGLEGRPEERSLILAMTLGLRAELSRRLTRAFRHAGTIHIFAISGLHVVVVAGILAVILGCLGIPRHRWVLVLAPLIAGYVLLTGAPASAMRAGLMVTLYYLGPFLGRRSDPLNTLAATILVLLVASPLQLRNLGFILSFSMVLGLILCAGPFVRLFQRLFRVERLRDAISLETEALSMGEASPGARVRAVALRAAGRVVEGTADTIGVSVAAAFISLPLTAFYFDMLVPFSILANVVVVPLSGIVMTSAAASLLVSCLFPPLSLPFNWFAASGAWVMKRASQGVASLPGAAVEVAFPLWALALWYGLLALLVLAWTRIERNIGKNSDKNLENAPNSLTSEI